MAGTKKPPLKLLALVAALALGASACADGDESPASYPPTPAEAPDATQAPTAEPAPEGAAPAPASDLPSVEMVDVSTGGTVNLASFAPSDRHIVLWFWAPH